jgi:hypothetical protein
MPESRWNLEIIPQAPAMKRFWEPYFNDSDCSLVHIVYAEHVFFRIGHEGRTFIRHMDVNDENVTAQIRSKYKLPRRFQGGPLFVSAGDCSALLELVQQFERNGVRTNIIRFDRRGGWAPGEKEGVILVGNGRAVPWINEVMEEEGFDLRIESRRIVDRRRKNNPNDDFFLPMVKGIIARAFASNLGCWITIIAANHGRFSEGSIKCLTSERDLGRLFEARRWDPAKAIPKRFAFPATVDITELETLRANPGRPVPFTVSGEKD